jgi:serine/threonine protein phosphatase 1
MRYNSYGLEEINMAKFYVISDVHGYYDEMIKALDEAGFDPNNESHWLIVCGDIFDRGPSPYEVMKYLKSLPRKVLIRGNHMDLLEECCCRGEWYSHDISNGTYATICKLGGAAEGYDFSECCERTMTKTYALRKSMVNYFETENYIFVHAWVQLNCDDNLPPYYTRNRKYSKMENWREATEMQWEDARWGNPFELAENRLLPDKTLVFGHWHCSTGWAKLEGRSEFGKDAKFDPFYGDGFIALDGCTAHSKIVNVVVLEDEFITTQN